MTVWKIDQSDFIHPGIGLLMNTQKFSIAIWTGRWIYSVALPLFITIDGKNILLLTSPQIAEEA